MASLVSPGPVVSATLVVLETFLYAPNVYIKPS